MWKTNGRGGEHARLAPRTSLPVAAQKEVTMSESMRKTICRHNERWTELANLLRCHPLDVLSEVQHLIRQRDEFANETAKLRERL